MSPKHDRSMPSASSKSDASSAMVPLLSDMEVEATVEEETSPAVNDANNKQERKAFSTAEYKIAFSHFLRIFSYSTKHEKLLLFVASSASICTGVTLPLMNVVFAQLVGAFGVFYSSESPDTNVFSQSINKNVLYMVYLFAGRLVLDYAAILGFRMASIRISAAMRLAYMKALFSQPVSVLDTLPPGQTAAIITITANILQIGISEKLSMFLQSISLVVTALVIAFRYSWLLTLVTSSGLLFIIVFYIVTIPLLANKMKEVEHADRISSSVASEVFSSIRMVVACEAEGKMAKRYAAWVKESQRRGLLMSPLVAIHQAPVIFAIHATFALSFWYAVKLYTELEITNVSTIIIVLTSIMTIVMSIGTISAPISAASRAADAASILFSIIDAPQPLTEGFKGPVVSSREDITFENVNFAYPARPDVQVLNNLSIDFPAGKLTAIVGESGSGKSTIVGMIERWYELGKSRNSAGTTPFRTGSITIGGRHLCEIDLKWWRTQIGLVQQEPFLFNDTIFKNVEYGLIGTEWENESKEKKMELIKQACVEAFADEFVSRLPQGYDTHVGDAGIKLSGGQRQRLAIARSIVKQPKILILDEATSAIDVRGERIVQAALEKVSKNRTTITIAHRLSTIMKADNIVVLQNGKVVQQGTHDQLLADSEGPYWRLANAQQLALGGDSGTNMKPLDCSEPAKHDEDSVVFHKFSMDLEPSMKQERLIPRPERLLGSFALFIWEQKPQWRWYGIMVLGAVGAGGAFPLHAFFFAKLISLFNFFGQYLRDQTNWWCLMFTVLAVGAGISYFVLGWSSNVVSFHITSTYRQEYFQNVLAKPISYYDEDDNSVGALTARMASDPTQLQQLLGINMAVVFISIFNIVGCISMSFYFGWKLTLLTVCSSMPIILIAGFFRIRYETQFEKMNWEVFAESSKFATESIGAFRTVSSLTLEQEICGRYETLLHNHTKKAFQKAKFSTLVFAISDSIALLCMAFVLWFGGQLLASHEYAPFNYLVVYLAVVQGSVSAGQSLSFDISQAFAAANRIRRMRPQKNGDNRSPRNDLHSLEAGEKEPRGMKIELKNVVFKYPTRDVPVLNGLNMTIERGQFAAIVGPSGCGKTSIISILERFYEVQSGKIYYHDTDIRDIPLSQYRNSISLVSQEPSLFEGSIRDNILLGVDESEVSNETLYQVCRDAEIHDFVSSLPDGYNTAVGAKGVALSGGQKQRISIARALIRNPRVLLLDEATSNLDSETERSVQDVFERTGKGRTMIVVAHRLATVQNADVIFVISEGRVAEKGSHAALLRERGMYYQMCQSQALSR